VRRLVILLISFAIALATNFKLATIAVAITMQAEQIEVGDVGLVRALAKCVINFKNPLWRLKYIMLESNNKKKKILA
jgi:hypothetical protein